MSVRTRSFDDFVTAAMRELFSALSVPDLLVLSYHAVSETWPAALSVTPERFEEQLRSLVEVGYRGATFSEGVSAAPEAKTVVVTFDDGYHSVLTHALPVLERLGLPGTVFVPTDFVGTARPMSWPGVERWLGSPFEHELVPLSWEELGSLASGGWEVGSHTCSHPRLTELDDARLADELGRSREHCEAVLGNPCRALAYPFGAYDARVLEFAQAAGYEYACIVPHRMTAPAPLAWPRVGVYHADSQRTFRFKVSPTVRRLRALPLLQPLDRVRRSVRRRATG
jgi:peptidoglycan/xylan/chitin deacetylase (PgdA/CDA1 family)